MATNDFRFENIKGDGNARQHIGNSYNTNNNYHPPIPLHLPLQPPKHQVHVDFIRACVEDRWSNRLDFLRSRGADIEYRDKDDWTLLHHAAFSGSVNAVRYLLDAGADIHASDTWVGTPLCLEAIEGHLAVVELLIQYKVRINQYGNHLGSAAHAACAKGNMAVVRALSDAGADFKSKQSLFLSRFDKLLGTEDPLVVGSQTQSSGALAVVFRHPKVVDFCLCLADGLSEDEPWWLRASSAPLSQIYLSTGTKMITLTLLAISKLDLATAKILLEARPIYSGMGSVEENVLVCVFQAYSFGAGDYDDLQTCIRLLLNHRVDINAQTEVYVRPDIIFRPKYHKVRFQPHSETALVQNLRLARKSRLDCIALLCRHGVDVHAKDSAGLGIMDHARFRLEIEEGNEVERVLLRERPDFCL